MSEYAFSQYANADYSTTPTGDFDVGKQYFATSDMSTEELDKIYEYFVLCIIGIYNKVLQMYYDDFSEYRGKDYITIHEAVVMMQLCLTDIEFDGRGVDRYSKEFIKLYFDAHFSGILKKQDLIYWSLLDAKADREDIYILLSRLLNQKRYKYISGNAKSKPSDKSLVDEKRSITYLEYLCQMDGSPDTPPLGGE